MNKKTLSTILSTASLLVAVAILSACQGSLPFKVEAAQPTPTTAPVQADTAITAEGHIAPRDFVRLGFSVPGEVQEILVIEGDQVSTGAVLARLNKAESYNAALTAAQLELDNAQQAVDDLNKKADLAGGQAQQALHEAEKALIEASQRLDELDTDATQTEIDDAWVEVTKAKDELDTAQEDFDKVKNLDAENANYKNADTALKDAQKKYDDKLRAHDLLVNNLDQARADVALAQARKDDAQREYEARRTGPDPDLMKLAQSRLDNAKAQLAAAQAAMDDLELKAPFAGVVTEVNIAQGEHVVPNQPVFVVADLSQLYVETSDLTEMDVVKIEEGQKVTVVPDALPDLALRGLVDTIAKGSGEKGGDIVYKVRIKLLDTDPLLRWGMTVNNTFNK